MKIVLGFVFMLFVFFAEANNIRVTGKAKVVEFVGASRDTAVVEVNVAWDNSWRDDFNWDAAWIFLKYKKRGNSPQWHHAYLCREGNEAKAADGSYSFMFGEVGTAPAAKVTGLYLMRDGVSEGNVEATLRIKWALRANAKEPLKPDDFGTNRDSIYLSAYAVEMVYVPFGAYYLGDNYSNGTFKRRKGPIPSSVDIINLSSGYIYSTGTSVITGSADYVADHSPEATYSASTCYFHAPSYWQVDFKTQKEIKYFGVAGAENYPDCTPKGKWYLKGSNDLINWTTVSTRQDSVGWCYTKIAYPVQKSMKVTNPGKYRYYRMEISASNRPSDYGIVIQSIAMSERDLEADGSLLEVGSERALELRTELWAADGTDWSGTLPASYPKGYRGFFMMKYELSQEQYVDFLNVLTPEQQKRRVGNSDFKNMKRGDYVFGDPKRPNNRNGIAFIEMKPSEGVAMFGNNLTQDTLFMSKNDGQTLACNYLSPADMLAYCDWSGLRPMSEMEYEKACRRPSPQEPEEAEYAWNSSTGLKRLGTLSELKDAGTGNEMPASADYNVNAGNGLSGPVRAGAFATPSSSQVQAGASYWGLMEMSGNLWEMCYNANVEGRKFVADNVNSSHGDGYIADGGTDIAATVWQATAAAFAVRGGNFASSDELLRTSDRTYAKGNYFPTMDRRDSTTGFRAVRSVLNTTGFTGGELFCRNGRTTDTICPNLDYTITGNAAQNAIGKITYYWYVSGDGGKSWEPLNGESGESLTYRKFTNEAAANRVLQFKRKAVCAVGEEETVPVVLTVLPVLKKPELDSYAYFAGLGYRFVFPKALENSIKSRWVYPSGTDVAAADAIIENYTVRDDGTYKLYYVEEHGCESGKVEVKIIGAYELPIVNYGKYRAWADGSGAVLANGYLHPEAPYVYKGATGDGVYRLQSEGSGTDAVNVYCDMTGGWMMVLAQFELDPVSNWNEGVQADYDPSLKTLRGFALNTAQIPPHTQTAWGKQLDPTFVGYSNFLYTTGTIPLQTILNIKTDINFQVHRNPSNYYSGHDPESNGGKIYSSSDWNNTLTYDKVGGMFFNWSFSPNHATYYYKGYGMSGQVCYVVDAYAWTVWVR